MLILGGKGGLPRGSEPVTLDPADFSVNIDNSYWPMSPGSKWVYSETDTQGSHQKVVVESRADTASTAAGGTSPLADTGGAFSLTPLAPLALLGLLVGAGVVAFGAAQRA